MGAQVDSIPARCPCGAILGRMVPAVNGAKLIVDGGWEIFDGGRTCPDCGRRFRFRPPVHTWQKLVERYLRNDAAIAAELIGGG